MTSLQNSQKCISVDEECRINLLIFFKMTLLNPNILSLFHLHVPSRLKILAIMLIHILQLFSQQMRLFPPCILTFWAPHDMSQVLQLLNLDGIPNFSGLQHLLLYRPSLFSIFLCMSHNSKASRRSEIFLFSVHRIIQRTHSISTILSFIVLKGSCG